MKAKIQEMLDFLAYYQAQRDALLLERQEAVKKILTPEIEQQIIDIEVEFAGKAEGVTQNISELEQEIKTAVLRGSATVRGTHLMAVYNKPRVSWNAEVLEALAVDTPAILKARHFSEPSVSIRAAK